jgi:hypothetical protein
VFWRGRWWVNWSRVVDARGEGQRGVALDAVSDGDQRDLRRLLAGLLKRRCKGDNCKVAEQNVRSEAI